jgi:S1-C subfamily serine protease
MYRDLNPFTFLRANSDGRDNVRESRNNVWRGIETMNYFKRLVSKYAISLWTGALLAIAIPITAFAAPSAEAILNAVIQVHATIPGTARTANSLGTERRGSGIVIDSSGLVLTIGYLILEARDVTLTDNSGHSVPAEIIAYDYGTGFGLLRARQPLGIQPVQFGNSDTANVRDVVLAVGHGRSAVQVRIAAQREYAGYWEYLLDDAIFTAPPFSDYAGAALIDQTGNLIGVGSLMLQDAGRPGTPSPGNMFVPIDALKDILADLIDQGRSSEPENPWLGLFANEYLGRIFVSSVSADGPAERAGVKVGDIIAGVAGQPMNDLARFYRAVWAVGEPGVSVPLDVFTTKSKLVNIDVISGNRYDWLKFGVSN